MKAAIRLWSRFQGKAAKVERGPFFDRSSTFTYATIIAALFIEIAVILATTFTISPNQLLSTFYGAISLVMVGVIARRYGLGRIGAALEGTALCLVLGALTAVGTVLISAASAPFVDDELIHVDQLLGFDWLFLLRLYQTHEWLVTISNFAYKSLVPQMMLVPTILFLTDRHESGWRFINAWALASVVTVLVFPFFPAKGPYVVFNLPHGALPGIEWDWPWTFGAKIEAIRTGELRDVSEAMTGLVSFPSFHAAAGIMLAWGMWSVRSARWPFVLLNVALIFSTIIRGSHYLVDVLGGGLLAMTAIQSSSWLTSRGWLGKPQLDLASQTGEVEADQAA